MNASWHTNVDGEIPQGPTDSWRATTNQWLPQTLKKLAYLHLVIYWCYTLTHTNIILVFYRCLTVYHWLVSDSPCSLDLKWMHDSPASASSIPPNYYKHALPNPDCYIYFTCIDTQYLYLFRVQYKNKPMSVEQISHIKYINYHFYFLFYMLESHR